MRFAPLQLVSDFLSALVFLPRYLCSDNLSLATTVAIAVGLAQFAYLKAQAMADRRHAMACPRPSAGRSHPDQQDGRLIMLKPTMVHWAIARNGIAKPVLVAAGYAWAGLMFVLGAANVVVALSKSFQAWVWFVTFIAGGAKVIAFLAQYWVLQALLGQRASERALAPLLAP